MTNINEIAKEWIDNSSWPSDSTPAYLVKRFASYLCAHYTLTPKGGVKPEEVPEAARAMFTCFHKFTPSNPLDTADISVYCPKCGTTVEGEKIIPPVAYSAPKEEVKECEHQFKDIPEGMKEEIDGWMCQKCDAKSLCVKCGKLNSKPQPVKPQIEPLEPRLTGEGVTAALSYSIKDLYDKLNELISAFNAHINK